MRITSFGPKFMNNLPKSYTLDLGDKAKIKSYRENASRKRRDMKTVKKGELWVLYHCDFCDNDFQVTYGPSTKHCPYCGSTSAFKEKTK